ncbi:MAG TPA: hypothetical protein VKK79_11370 [Candidatus Lokiarchaeia archaeon]|nr:hypothetical protein [Candidatus Lokiarchaeia archaeon]
MRKSYGKGLFILAGILILSFAVFNQSAGLSPNGWQVRAQPHSSAGVPNVVIVTNGTWSYGTGFQTQANAIAVDAAGAMYMTGYVVFPSGDGYAIVAKFAPGSSVPTWNKTVLGPGSAPTTAGYGIAVDPAGNVVVVCTEFVTDPSATDVCVLKYGPDGSLLWNRTWGEPNVYDWGNAIATDAAGNCYVAGSTKLHDASQQDALLLKYTPDGTRVWNVTWGNASNYEAGNGVAVDASGNALLAGDYHDSNRGEESLFVAAFSPSNANLWNSSWWNSGIVNDYGNSIAVGPDGNLYVAGYNDSSNYILVKFDASGNHLWDTTNGASPARGMGVAVDAYGNCFLGGYIGSTAHAYVYQYAVNGSFLTYGTWGGPGNDLLNGIALAPNGDLIAVGSTSSWTGGQTNLMWVEFSPFGISHPANMSYLASTTGHLITWNITNPQAGASPSYVVYLNGISNASGAWHSGIPFHVPVDGLDPGTWNYSIVADNNGGAHFIFTDWVLVTIFNHLPVVVAGVPAFTFQNGTTGHVLNWTITDDSIKTATYAILRNGTQVNSSTWTSGSVVTLPVDELAPGSYNFTIVVQDGYSVNGTVAATVIVTITAPVGGTPLTFDPHIIGVVVGIAGMAVLGLVAAVDYKRTLKRRLVRV